MKEKLKRLTSGLLSAVMVLTMIAGILPTMAVPTEAADAIDATGEKRPIVSVSTYDELKDALESETDSYICLSDNIEKNFFEEDDIPEYKCKYSSKKNLRVCDNHGHYEELYEFYESFCVRIMVKGNHTLNLNGFTIDICEEYLWGGYSYKALIPGHAFCDIYVLFGIENGVTFTVEDEWKKNATEATPASEQQGQILYNADNFQMTSYNHTMRSAIFAAGLAPNGTTYHPFYDGSETSGKLIINSGYYCCGTNKKFIHGGVWSKYEMWAHTRGYVAVLCKNKAEMVVNGGTLVGYNSSKVQERIDDNKTNRQDIRTGIIGVGENCKLTINGGKFIAMDGANIVSPFYFLDHAEWLWDAEKMGEYTVDESRKYARNSDGELMYELIDACEKSCCRRYAQVYYDASGSEVDVRGGEFLFSSLYVTNPGQNNVHEGDVYGKFCPTDFMDEWMPKNINKHDVVTGSFSVAPSFGTPDITTETEYDGSSYATPGGKVDTGSEVSSRIDYALWNKNTTLNMTANVDGGYYMADYSVKDMIAQQGDIYNGGGVAVSKRSTTWKFWDNSDGKANVSGNPTFEKEVYGDTLDLTSAKIPTAYKNVTKWIVRVEVKDELFRHSGLYKSLQSKPSTVFHIYVTGLPTSKNMLDPDIFGYTLNHSQGGEILSFKPNYSIAEIINGVGDADDIYGISNTKYYNLESVAITASLNGCTHNHVPYEDITCGTVTNTCDSVTFAVKYSLTDKNGNNMQFTLGENVPMMSVAVSNATKTGDGMYSFSGSAQLSVPASKTGDFNHNFTEVGNWYQQVGVDKNGQPRWAKNYGSAEKALTVGETGVYTYSYIRADGTVFYAKPVTIVNAKATVKFEGDGLVFEKTDYRPGVVNQNSMLTICADEIPISGSAERTGYFTMNLKPNAELKKRFDNDTAQITVMMTEYPEEYNYPDSGLYGALKYEYTPDSADEKVFFWKFFNSGYSSHYLRNGDYTFVAYVKDNNGNILAISKPVTITFEMVPSSKEYGRLYDSETGEMVEESINLRVGEKTVLDFGFLDQYRGWNMDYTTIKSAVENTELGSGIIKVTPDYAAKTVTIEARKEGTSGVLVDWNYKNAGGNSVDGQIGARVNVYDTKVFELTLDDIGYGRVVDGANDFAPVITSYSGANGSSIEWKTGYEEGDQEYFIIANEEVTAKITLYVNGEFNPEFINPDNIVVKIDGVEYTGRELNGWCTGTGTRWMFHFVWSFGTFHNDAYTYLEKAEMTKYTAPVVGDSCGLGLPGDVYNGFTVTAVEVVELTNGAGDSDPSNDEGFTRSASDKFVGGENYRIAFTLEAKTDEDIYFDEDMTVIIGGVESPKESVDEGFEEVIAYYYFTPKFGDGSKKPMTGFKVQAVTAPKTDAVPMTEGSLSLKGVAGELPTTAIYVAGLTWYLDANGNGVCDEGEIAEVQYQYNEETGEEEEIFVNLNDDGTFKADSVYGVILYVALSNDEDEDGVDDTTGIFLPENEEDIPDFPAVVDGKSVEMDKEYSNGMLIYSYTFPATEGDGVTISGKVKSFGTGTTTVELLDENGDDAGFTPCTGTETEFTYTFTNVPAGDYIIRVKKANHVTRDYKVSVE